MDPKDAKALLDKLQKERAEEKARIQSEREQQEQRGRETVAAGAKAINEIILPYFAELQRELGNIFEYHVTGTDRLSDGYGVQFGMAGAPRVQITAMAHGVQLLLVKGNNLIRSGVVRDANIQSPADLTREKVGILVKRAIEGTLM